MLLGKTRWFFFHRQMALYLLRLGILAEWLDGRDFQAKARGIDKGMTDFLLPRVDFIDPVIGYCAAV